MPPDEAAWNARALFAALDSASLRRIAATLRALLLPGLSWNVLSSVAAQGSVLVTAVVVARILGAREFGAYAVLVMTAATVAAIAAGGTGVTATKFVAEWLHTDRERVRRLLSVCRILTLATGLMAALALLALAPFIAGAVLGKADLAEELRWIALGIVFQVVVGYQQGALQGLGAFAAVGRSAAQAAVLYLGCSIIGAALGGLTGALIGYVAGHAARAMAVSFALRRELAARGLMGSAPLQPGDWQVMWSFALPASLAGLVTLPCLWAATALVTRQPEGLLWVAFFAAAHQVRMAVLQVPSLLNMVSFSVLSRLRGAGDPAGAREVFWSGMVSGLLGVCLIAAAAAWAVEPILALFGPDFTAARLLLMLLLLSTLPEFLSGAAYQLVQSAGRMWHSLWFIALPRDLGYVVLVASLLPVFALEGAGVAYLACQVIGLILTLILVARLRGMRRNTP